MCYKLKRASLFHQCELWPKKTYNTRQRLRLTLVYDKYFKLQLGPGAYGLCYKTFLVQNLVLFIIS